MTELADERIAPVTAVVDDPPVEIEAPEAEPSPSKPPLLTRIGRRIIRRPSRWLNAPWPTERIVQYLTALALVGGATFAVLQVVHLDLVFTNNTPTGGDMGAHVMAPAYLRDVLLPNGQLSGWSMYWYAGFPMYRFYMVIPALMIVGLNALWIPYGVAFKIVAILGLVTLPFCCWAFGRLARFRYPIPELMALAGMLFLFDESFSIYGGNVKSTMAGEFSFSIALSFAILGFGLLARGLQTGKYRSWAAIVLALALLSHGVVAIFVVLGAVLLWLIYMDKARFKYGLGVLAGAALLSAFWIVPFLFNHQYMTDMKYGFRPDGATDSFWKMFFQYPPFWDILVNGLALAGFAFAIARRQLVGCWLGILCFALMALTYITRDSLPVIGLLWNPRLLPFLYLTRLLLMMVGIVEVVHYAIRNWQGVRQLSTRTAWIAGVSTAAFVGLVILVVTLFIFREVPGGHYTTKNGKSVYAWGINGWDPITLTPTSQDAVADGWTRYNFEGYEGRPAYAEYKALIDTMAGLGQDPSFGCGRAIWENNEATGVVRHDDGADAPAALDRRLHRQHGGPVLRGLGHHALPLPHGLGDQHEELRPGARAALRRQRHGQGRAVHAVARRALPDGVHPGGQGPGRRARLRGGPAADARGRERAVEDLRGRRQPVGRGTGHPAGRRQPAQR